MSKMKNKHDFPGVLISLEGGEGGGKTTQTALLTKELEKRGWEVLNFREPGGTKISEEIRDVVLSKKNMEMEDETEVLLYQASRAQLYGEVILPTLATGKVILMDRTGDSSVVYQGMVRGIGRKKIQSLNEFSMHGLKPDLTFLLDLPPEIGLKRVGEQNVNRIELQGLAFHQKVRKAYLKLAEEDEDDRWRVIDAGQDFAIVHQQILAEIEKFLEEKFSQEIED